MFIVSRDEYQDGFGGVGRRYFVVENGDLEEIPLNETYENGALVDIDPLCSVDPAGCAVCLKNRDKCGGIYCECFDYAETVRGWNYWDGKRRCTLTVGEESEWREEDDPDLIRVVEKAIETLGPPRNVDTGIDVYTTDTVDLYRSIWADAFESYYFDEADFEPFATVGLREYFDLAERIAGEAGQELSEEAVRDLAYRLKARDGEGLLKRGEGGELLYSPELTKYIEYIIEEDNHEQ